MNHLLFTALLIALLYYFCYYLPHQQQITNPSLTKPLTHSQFTQTEPTQIVIERDNQKLEELKLKNQGLIAKNKDYQKQITSLQAEVRDLVKRPLLPTNSKSTQTDSETELTNTLDTLIKNIQELNHELD